MAMRDFHAFLARVNELVDYNQATGEFRWKVGRPGASQGAVIGTIRPDGYRQLRIADRLVLAHRLAFMMCHSKEPVGEVDHANRLKDDNRIANLREATKSQNGANKRPAADGLKGASWCKRARKWRASIRKDRKQFHLGLFDTAEDAHRAYISAARSLHGEFARGA